MAWHMKKEWLLFSLIALLTAGISGAAAYAWLIDRDEAANKVGFAECDIHIEEKFEPPEEPKPGDTIIKKPCLVNDSPVEVFVRARVCFSDSDAQDMCEPLMLNRDWSYEEDGYYYYGKKLPSGEKTSTIFDNIVIKDTVKKENLVPFDVLVYGEAVQAEGFSSAQEAFETL